MRTFKRFYSIIKEDSLLYCIAIIARILATILWSTVPIIIKVFIDNILYDNEVKINKLVLTILNFLGGQEYLKNNLYISGLVLLFTVILASFFMFLGQYIASSVSEKSIKNLRDKLYSHIQNLSYDYHMNARTGDLIQRCTSDIDMIRRLFSSQIIQIVRIVVVLIFTLYIMFSVNVKLTLIASITFPIIFLFSFVFFNNVKRVFNEVEISESELATTLQENLSGIRVVKAFNQSKNEIEKFENKNKKLKLLSEQLNKYIAYYWSASDFICYVQILIVLIVGIKYTVSGVITLGTFILFNSYMDSLLWPLRGLGRILSDIGKTEVSLNRIYNILNVEEEKDSENPKYPELNADIVFDNVSFSYNSSNEVLKGLSFKVNKGDTISILAPTGAGKSTIMLLLLRLYDYKGSIKINNVELNQISKKHLRKNIATVLQDPFLFSKTIKENIKIANKNASDKDMYEVAKIAEIDDSIKNFSKGYDTFIGEKGATLSGGQKQRIAISRALIKNSDILIFDDSLSAVDSETDFKIRKSLQKRKADTTTFVISQRISTLKESDKILVIEDGKISDEGTHDDLIKRKGLYQKLWKLQNMGD